MTRTEPRRVTWFAAGLASIPGDDAWMDEFERTRIGSMRYAKRRSESLLSRHTAKTTLARSVGLEPGPDSLRRVTIRNAPDGAPEAYVDGADAGVVISMTDRADWAVCAVLHGSVRVGCDLELVERRSPAFIADYFTPAEQRTAMDREGEERAELANLIWSAKESALKVLRTGLRRDTRSVEVRLEERNGEGWQGLSVRSGSDHFPGWWIRYGEFLLTCVAAQEIAEPASLVDPPPLAEAVPSHGWMQHPGR